MSQAGLSKKKGLKPVGGGVQKQGAANGRVKAVPVRVSGGQRGGGGGRRGGPGGRGAGGRQQTQQPLHPAALKITIRNDKVRRWGHMLERRCILGACWGLG